MDGLSEKIEEILGGHADTIRRYKEEEEKLNSAIRFFSEHKFEEEKRIALIKWQSTNMILYNYKELFNEIQKAINNWNS